MYYDASPCQLRAHGGDDGSRGPSPPSPFVMMMPQQEGRVRPSPGEIETDRRCRVEQVGVGDPLTDQSDGAWAMRRNPQDRRTSNEPKVTAACVSRQMLIVK